MSAERMGAAILAFAGTLPGLGCCFYCCCCLLPLRGCWGCPLQGTGARLGELRGGGGGGVCLLGGGVGMRLGLLTTFVTSRPGWLV